MVLTLSFSNCGQPGSIAAKLPSDTVIFNTEVIDEVLQNCANARASGTLRTHNEMVRFEDSRVETGRTQICEFGVNDNLNMEDGHMRARHDQNVKLNVPANAVICDVRMTNNLQKFRYDDVFFFTLNGFLLASNNKTAVQNRLTPSNLQYGNKNMSIYRYNWLALRDHEFDNVVDDYCVGKAQNESMCSWPVTEKDGNIQFSFNQALLIALSLGTPSQNLNFGFTITGDNDPNLDCYHERLDFSMAVDYFVPVN